MVKRNGDIFEDMLVVLFANMGMLFFVPNGFVVLPIVASRYPKNT